MLVFNLLWYKKDLSWLTVCVDYCQSSSELMPPKPFGTVFMASTVGRLALIRYVLLNVMINGYEYRNPV